jgi:hypothetical protein
MFFIREGKAMNADSVSRSLVNQLFQVNVSLEADIVMSCCDLSCADGSEALLDRTAELLVYWKKMVSYSHEYRVDEFGVAIVAATQALIQLRSWMYQNYLAHENAKEVLERLFATEEEQPMLHEG